MTEIDEAIVHLQRQRDDVTAQIDDLNLRLAGIGGELRGLEHAKELFSPPESVGRLDVQGPVMAAMGRVGACSETVLLAEANLPPATVHKFLLRAVRTGRLVCQDGVYSLPAAPSARAAE